ncbi:MAG: PA14 domain-containing protein, partial [Planctomycetota bacterium]
MGSRRTVASLVAFVVLGVAIGVAILVPQSRPQSRGQSEPPAEITLVGSLRDFRADHPDFDVSPVDGLSHDAGLVTLRLDEAIRQPILDGVGQGVITQARDGQSRNIAPHLAAGVFGGEGGELTVLLVVGDAGSLSEMDQLRKDAIESWGHTVVVIDDGARRSAYDAAVASSNVAYVSEQACFNLLGTKLADAPIGVVSEHPNLTDEFGFASRVKTLIDDEIVMIDIDHPITEGFSRGSLTIASADWCMHRTDGRVAPGGDQLATVKGGASKPALMAVESGAELHSGRTAPARRVRLPWGQLQQNSGESSGGCDGADSSSAGSGCCFVGSVSDGSDCGIQVQDTGSDDSSGGGWDSGGLEFSLINENGLTIMRRAIEWAAGDPCSGQLSGDTQAAFSGTPSAGGIDSTTTFDQWFRDDLTVNSSANIYIKLIRQTDGIYVFDDTTDERYAELGGFFPIDSRLFGNEGDDHNYFFTYAISARFTYRAGENQFFRYAGNGDSWVYVSDKLGLDVGGLHGVLDQRLELS